MSPKRIAMKSITSVIAVAAFILSVPLLAQEESPAAESEETPATEVEESPAAPAPTATESKPVAARPTATSTAVAQPSAQKEPSAAAEIRPTPAPTTSVAPAAGKKLSGPEALKDGENRWAAAIGKHDMAAVEALIATDYIGVNPKGKVQNRRAVLNDVKGDKDAYSSNKNEKMDVRMFGTSIGVVAGTYREKGTGKDGKAFDRTYRFTDTWMDRGGQWQCVASQVMLVTQK
jgi:ketosteroid isomerase-like protein